MSDMLKIGIKYPTNEHIHRLWGRPKVGCEKQYEKFKKKVERKVRRQGALTNENIYYLIRDAFYEAEWKNADGVWEAPIKPPIRERIKNIISNFRNGWVTVSIPYPDHPWPDPRTKPIRKKNNE